MEKTTLPVLLSIPHGGTRKPDELIENLCITENDLFDDIDPFVIEIYNLENKVQKVISTDIPRTIVDLNRSLQDLPPKNPDGVVKSMTCYQKQIYVKGKEPNDDLTKKIINSYYKPYHRQIQKAISELDLQLCLDCHSMAEFAPSIAPDKNKTERPLFCLSNQDGNTSSYEMIELLAKCLSQSFSINEREIKLNEPFKGGYITKTYGNNPIPWIQVEMNRNLYLAEPWFDRTSLKMNQARLKELNKMFEETLDLFFDKNTF